MPEIFVKRFWGFSPEQWPIVSFGLDGNRRDLINKSKPGDMIAFVGTMTAEVRPDEQGRLLGIAEFGRQEIDSLDVLAPSAIHSEHYNKRGEFKWPKALPMVRAWRFVDKPMLLDVLDEQLTYEATIRAVTLSEREQLALSELKRVEMPLPNLDVLKRYRAENDALFSGRATTGPVPSFRKGGGSHDPTRTGFTYAMRFGKRNLWKIGWCGDVDNRLRAINKHIPIELLDEEWRLHLRKKWGTRKKAYEMEQRLLGLLEAKRTRGERVSCSQTELDALWVTALVGY
tara:strand:+ start:4362 stop:5219 length:858 start_codon:yes stop_codon:yes gene_type:complete